MEEGRRFKSGETMAVQSVTQSVPPPRSKALTRKFMENAKTPFAAAMVFTDAVLAFLIIAYVPYTKIDWDAYMSQVSGFLGGERDYRNLKGDTGPLVYPAGFLCIDSAFQYFTGGEVYPALILFGFLYILNLAIILSIYLKTDVLPWFNYVQAVDISGVLSALAGAALVQILLGLPVLVSHPVAYISRAFNLGRVFIHFWSVNFKFMPELVFISKRFAIFLLATHLMLLTVHCRWCK